MKEIIPKDTRYVPLTQQRSCCVPASISIIMYKLGIPLVSQEVLGYHLGLIIRKKHKNLFWNQKTGKKYKTGYGVNKSITEYNKVFKKLKIPLKIITYPIKNFKTTEEIISFIENLCKKDKDFSVILNSGVLNNNKKKAGHMCVVDRIYPNKKSVRLIDPSFNRPKWRIIEISKLKKAMELHPTKEGGAFWEFEKINL